METVPPSFTGYCIFVLSGIGTTISLNPIASDVLEEREAGSFIAVLLWEAVELFPEPDSFELLLHPEMETINAATAPNSKARFQRRPVFLSAFILLIPFFSLSCWLQPFQYIVVLPFMQSADRNTICQIWK